MALIFLRCRKPRESALGHEDQFPPPTLSVRRGLGEATFGGTLGNGRDAPKADMILGLTAPPLRPEALDKLSVACRAGSGG